MIIVPFFLLTTYVCFNA